MELLVYVRNHGGRGRGSTYVGASVGEAPTLERLEMQEPLTSLAEFRVDASVPDPVAELRESVRRLFEIIEADETYERSFYLMRNHSAIRVRLEPGFDRPFEIERELAEMLALCSPRVSASIPSPRPAAVA